MEVDVERCPFRPQRQKQERHMLLDFVAHLMLKNIGARGSCQGEIKFLAPKIYLLANTNTPTQKSILQITLHLDVPTHAQGYSRSLRSQISSTPSGNRHYELVYGNTGFGLVHAPPAAMINSATLPGTGLRHQIGSSAMA
jgi:hypothetical protein